MSAMFVHNACPVNIQLIALRKSYEIWKVLSCLVASTGIFMWSSSLAVSQAMMDLALEHPQEGCKYCYPGVLEAKQSYIYSKLKSKSTKYI